MKIVLVLIFTCITLCSLAQLTPVNQRVIDSLYPVASNTDTTLDARARAYHRCCWNCIYQDYQLGLKISSEYLEFARQNDIPNREIFALHFLGYTQLMLGRMEAAESSHRLGLELSLTHDNKKGAAEAYADLGNLHNEIGEVEIALSFHEKSLNLAQEIGNSVTETRAYINIAEIYESQGLFDQTIKYLQKARRLSEKKKFTGFLSAVYEHLGNANIGIEEFDRAKQYYLLSWKYAHREPNENRKIQSLKKLGELHEQQENLDSAMFYYYRAIDFCLKNEAQAKLAHIRSKAANVLLAQNQLDKALDLMNQSLTAYNISNFQNGLDETLLIAGKIEFKRNRFAESEQYFKRCLNLVEKSQNIYLLEKVSASLYNLYKSTERPDLALKYYEKLTTYREQLESESRIKEVLRTELQTEYRNRLIKDSLELNKELEIKEIEHKQQEEKSRFNFYISLFGIAMLAIALGFVGYVLIQKRKSNRVLKENNEVINQALKDKEVLLQEVHHRVKNNMQVVSSLLHLKSKNSKNDESKTALLTSKSQIDSMLLSHQRMYQNGNYEHIDILGLTNDIFSSLLSTTKQDGDEFVVTKGEQLVEVAKAQILGYILHELVTNSLKYAWNDGEQKRIELAVERNGETIQISYLDNGKGLPLDFDFEKGSSVGMKVIQAMVVRQLEGSIEAFSSNGAVFRIIFESKEA